MTADTIQSLSTDPQAVERLIGLLEEQRGLFDALRALSDRQAALVADAAADELLSVLGQRQTIIDQLIAANDRLEPYRRNWTKLYAELDEAQRRQVGALLREVQEQLGLILEQDERDRHTLQSHQGQIGRELQGMSRAGTAVQAYRRAPQQVSPRFTDHQG